MIETLIDGFACFCLFVCLFENVWDLGGQESTRSGWSTYFLGTHAVIIVVDSTDRQRIGQVKAELWKLLASQELTNAVLLILANKADLVKQIPESDHMNGKPYAQPSSSSSSTPPPSSSSTSAVISSSSSASVNTLPSPSHSPSLSHPRPNPCMTPADIAEELNLQSIKTHSWHIQSCCALTGEGLYEVRPTNMRMEENYGGQSIPRRSSQL